MKIFKFGGASVKDAGAIRNVGNILGRFPGERIVVVISAMGKTTNALEVIAQKAYENVDYTEPLNLLITGHQNIITALDLELSIDYFIDLLIQNLQANKDFSFPKYYDQVVSIGELISTTIVSNYLNKAGIKNTWTDARDFIATDASWRDAGIQWEKTQEQVHSNIPGLLAEGHIITQGYIGKTDEGLTSTLGREGSDYTGAILANILDAEGLWIWKDVPGVLSADPKFFTDAIKIPELTYYEATEMTYSGAQVIHPKTIYPLRQKKIPLYVKSFVEPVLDGTIICTDDKFISYPPIIVVKKDQVLMSINPSDLSFVAEEHLRNIYSIFARHHVKINLIQTAAQTVSLGVDQNPYKIGPVLRDLKELYRVRENEQLELLTIRHFDEGIIEKLIAGKTVYIEQRTRHSVQFLYE